MSLCDSRITPVLMAALVLAGCGKEDRPAPAEQAQQPPVRADRSWPNVVLISVDSLRPDHLGCYGYPKETSPRIDRLADEGALFTNVISSSSCTLPAHCCMFTGLADSVHGCVDTDRQLHSAYYTLAERLRDTGCATVGFFSGAYLHAVFGVAQGFETYVDCTSYRQLSAEAAAATGTVEGEAIWKAMDRDITSPKVLQEVQRWLRENTRRPFFMFIHMGDVRFDFTPPPPYDTRFDPDYTGDVTGERFVFDPRINKDMPKRDLEHLIALYDGEIAWTDEHVGKILDELATLALLDSTIVILTADHGTAFFEHGLKGHRNALFEELIRIPLIIRYPARIASGQRFKQQVRTIDLLPTVLDMLGMPPRPAPLMGQSLAPLFAGGTLQRDEPAVSELFSWGRKLRSFRRPERKTIWDINADAGMVYDLTADPGELAPLEDQDSPVVEAAKGDILWSRRFLSAFRKQYPQSPRISDLPAKLLDKLRGAGYPGYEAPKAPEPAP